MELSLTKQDLLQVGPTAARSTMKLLPMSKKKKQKVVAGDDSGTVTCFEMKKGAAGIVFRTLPDQEISSLALGGSIGRKDRIFVASGQQIRGISKKGKEFFKFNTNLSEAITSMVVEETKIWTGGEYVYNLFDNGHDVHFFMSPDRINDIDTAKVTRETEYDAILGCQDRHLRLVSGSDLEFQHAVEGATTAVTTGSIGLSKPVTAKEKTVLYGTHNGMLGAVNVAADGMRQLWGLDASEGGRVRAGPVNSIVCTDLTNDGANEMVVGRDDGKLQVFGMSGGEVSMMWEQSVGESVRAIDAGQVSTPGYNEVVVCSYSGKVVSYTTEPLEVADTGDAYGRSKATVQKETQIVALRKEIEKLDEKLNKEREKFSKLASDYIPMEKQFKVNSSFALDPTEAAYRLTVEIPFAIDVVILQSSLPANLVDVEDSGATVSRTAPNPAMGNHLLATYRCHEEQKRLEMRLRTVEGQHGQVQVLVIAKLAPKTAQVINCDVQPLSMHHRVNEAPDERVMNTLRLTGSFTLAQMHEWVAKAIPGVPTRYTGDELRYTFRNAFIGTQLTAVCRRGEAVFESDNLSSIAILREFIAREATNRKITVSIDFDVKDETVRSVLELVHPKLEHTVGLDRKLELIDALKEIKVQDSEISFLSEEYADIVHNADKIRREAKERPRLLEMLYGIVSDLYVDMNKFKHRDMTRHIPELMQLLQRYNLEEICAFFDRH